MTMPPIYHTTATARAAIATLVQHVRWSGPGVPGDAAQREAAGRLAATLEVAAMLASDDARQVLGAAAAGVRAAGGGDRG